MKASKFIVLVGGILGILAFFLPLVSVERQGAKASVSAFDVIKGLDQVEVAVDQGASQAAYSIDTANEAKEGIGAMKGIVMAVFAPALLLSLLGAAGIARKKFGRVAGTFSLLAGLIGLGIGTILKSAAEGDGGIALTLLVVTGVAGIVGGLVALVKPERGATVQPTLATVGTSTRMAA